MSRFQTDPITNGDMAVNIYSIKTNHANKPSTSCHRMPDHPGLPTRPDCIGCKPCLEAATCGDQVHLNSVRRPGGEFIAMASTQPNIDGLQPNNFASLWQRGLGFQALHASTAQQLNYKNILDS